MRSGQLHQLLNRYRLPLRVIFIHHYLALQSSLFYSKHIAG